MKKVAVMMNTNSVGGAERSMLLQISNITDAQKVFFIPKLSKSGNLIDEIKNRKLGEVVEYVYPENIYGLSRSNLFQNPVGVIKDFFHLIISHDCLNELDKYDYVYLNGNKVALLFLIKNIRIHFKNKVIWHLRDYYSNSRFNNLIWKLIQNISPEQTTIVSNSHSVSKSLDHTPWENYPREVIYNPSGLNVSRSNPDFKTLGFVSMMAPWKGVHELLIWAKLYDKELSNLGIEKINIYGDDIYQTLGEHQSYKKDLIELKRKLNIKQIEFKGLKRPDEIFAEIDCLIHYSLRPEPFGRVIIEAFESGIPVISTALGGASEMIEDKNNGIKVFPYDRHGLFQAIEMLAKNKLIRLDFVRKSKAKSLIIQKEIEDKMNNLFIEEKAS